MGEKISKIRCKSLCLSTGGFLAVAYSIFELGKGYLSGVERFLVWTAATAGLCCVLFAIHFGIKTRKTALGRTGLIAAIVLLILLSAVSFFLWMTPTWNDIWFGPIPLSLNPEMQFFRG